MAGLGISLYRATGAWAPFSVITLEDLLTHLAASSQAYIEFGDVAFWKAGSQALLLMDVQVNRNRALGPMRGWNGRLEDPRCVL
jgi:hypothetical protein